MTELVPVQYALGSTVSTLVIFKSLGSTLQNVPAPKGFYQPYSELRPLAGGGVRGVGYPKIRWHWDFMTMAWYDIIRDILTAQSGNIHIASRVNDDADKFDYFYVKYMLPLELDLDSHHRMDFDIEYTHVVHETGPSA